MATDDTQVPAARRPDEPPHDPAPASSADPGGDQREFVPRDGGAGDDPARYLAAADGTQIPVPPDFPELLQRLQTLVAFGRNLAATLGTIGLDKLRELIGVIGRARGEAFIRPGGGGYEAALFVEALERFTAIVSDGAAADTAARDTAGTGEGAAG